MWARDLGVGIGLIPGVRGWRQGVLGTKRHLQWQQSWEGVWPQASSGGSHPGEGVWCPGVRAAASGHGVEVMVSSGEPLGEPSNPESQQFSGSRGNSVTS